MSSEAQRALGEPVPAGPGRDEVADLLGMSRELTRMPIFKEMTFRIGSREMSGRQVLQWWGHDIRRVSSPEYWVDRARLAARDSSTALVVFDDVRFPNEVSALDCCYRLEPYDGWVNTAGDHASETALDGFPFPPERVFRPCFGELGTLADRIVRELGL